MGSCDGNNKSDAKLETEEDLFDVNVRPEPAKRGRRVRKRCKKLDIESKRGLMLKICYCRFCQTTYAEGMQNLETKIIIIKKVLRVQN